MTRRRIDCSPEEVAAQVGGDVEEWREARDVLGRYWVDVWETVAHLAVRSIVPPAEVARILVGKRGYPGLVDVDWSAPDTLGTRRAGA